MPGVEGALPSGQELQEVRRRALAKLSDIGSDKLYQSDVDRVAQSDHYITRFWLHTYDLPGDQIDEAANMIATCLKWRKEFGVHEIKESDLKESILERGSLYSHNRDKDGKKLLVLSIGRHVKGAEKMEDLKKFFIYIMERLEREENGDEITMVFDCRNAGIKNLDMEFVQFVIGVFKDYYPNMLNYILVFEMPWVLNAAWKIIKGWLPAAGVKKIRFLTKATMGEYVNDQNRFEYWGGSDPWEYEYEYEAKTTAPTAPAAPLVNGNSQVEVLEESLRISALDESGRKKTVTFAELAMSPSNDSIASYVSAGADILRLTPGLEVVFAAAGSGELIARVQVQNICDKLVGFKIKTTSPEKYRVRPSSGVLQPGKSSGVEIHLTGQSPPSSLVRDKFLVTAVYLEDPNISTAMLQELLKKSKPDAQYRLRCQLANENPLSPSSFMSPQPGLKTPTSGAGGEGDPAKQLANLMKKINQLAERQEEIERQVTQGTRLQLILLAVSLVILLVVWLYLPVSLNVQDGPNLPDCQPGRAPPSEL